jgi:uncharacterized protein YqgC (DUF456 family)
MESTLFWLLAVALVLAGLAGTLLPVLPGIPLVFGGLALAAWIDSFQRVGWFTLLLLGSLAVAAVLIDFIAAGLGAKRVGASKLALAGAVVGTFAGIFFGLIGIFVGPFIGAVAGEFIARGRLGDAGKVGVATWLGLLFGTLAKIAVAFTMLGIFAASYLLG